jgi:polyisoprenoid-binding protein YceI
MSTITAPDLAVGTWTFDPAHTEIGFSVRHLMVSKVRGRFGKFEGTITIAPDPSESSASASIDMASVDTNEPNRDAHLRSSDFFAVDEHPAMTFTSTAVRPAGNDWVVAGDLTIHGVTRSVDLAVEFNGAGPDPFGGTRIGFSAETEISRKDFGIDLEMPLEGGGVVVGDKIKVTLEIEAVKA